MISHKNQLVYETLAQLCYLCYPCLSGSAVLPVSRWLRCVICFLVAQVCYLFLGGSGVLLVSRWLRYVTCVSVVQVQQDCLQDGVGVGVDQDDVVL